MKDIDARFTALSGSSFRSRFALGAREQADLNRHGLQIIRKHAERFIRERLAPAEPANDGKQTPMRNHPVFIAQHATATCCRGCLEKWHGIGRHRALNAVEQASICDVIIAWLEPRHDPASAESRRQGELFREQD